MSEPAKNESNMLLWTILVLLIVPSGGVLGAACCGGGCKPADPSPAPVASSAAQVVAAPSAAPFDRAGAAMGICRKWEVAKLVTNCVQTDSNAKFGTGNTRGMIEAMADEAQFDKVWAKFPLGEAYKHFDWSINRKAHVIVGVVDPATPAYKTQVKKAVEAL